MSPARPDLVLRRRRQEEDGEDEGSVPGDLDDDSLSEGSAITNDDDERDAYASDGSAEQEQATSRTANNVEVQKSDNTVKELPKTLSGPSLANQDKNEHGATHQAEPKTQDSAESRVTTQTTVDGAGMNNASDNNLTDVNIPKAPRNETLAQRNRREHQEYLKQRDTNPAFVPNRGGFFLHDNRTTPIQTVRSLNRGKGRGFNAPFVAGRGQPLADQTERQWTHDLHESEEISASFANKTAAEPHANVLQNNARTVVPPTLNRSFSFTSVLGNVVLQVRLPGMPDKKTSKSLVKRQHTLLPEHRPPLRRDKPVRISIPEEAPRYIFPSTERSFIFIPRALRPNQQSYTRARGRGSFQGSRRTSTFGESTYTPSIAMSRKSSFGGATRSGVRSPAEAAFGRPTITTVDPGRPIVRLPVTDSSSATPASARPLDQGYFLNGDFPLDIRSSSIPIHQPRPQKAVSVADIESPASMSFKPPQQQQEQPFHQQMPAHMAGTAGEDGQSRHSGQLQGTPLSHIPETAIYANPFQPYPVMQQQPMYFTGPYGSNSTFYPNTGDGMAFNPASGMLMASQFVPGSQSHPILQPGVPAMMQDANGMVYYYDPTQFTADGQTTHGQYHNTGTNPMMGMGNIGQTPYYYSTTASGMFYSAQTG